MFYWFIASIGMLIGMIAMEALGCRFSRRRLAANPKAKPAGLGIVEGAVFTLWGLLLAFAFTGAGDRIDERRKLIGDEAHAISAAYSYLELLPQGARLELKDLMRRYLDARIHLYAQVADASVRQENLEKVELIKNELWQRAVQACRDETRSFVGSSVLASITAMFGLAHQRYVAVFIHPMNVVFYSIVTISLICAFFAGLAQRHQINYIPLLVFAVVNSLFFYMICDMEYPRLGLIRIDELDQLLIEVRKGMN